MTPPDRRRSGSAEGRMWLAGNPGVLSVDDLREVSERFGVAEAQVRRDHAISHVLAVISDRLPDAVILFGGTALSRTHLVHARLSEDIDLIATGPRRDTAEQFVRALDVGLRRVLGRPHWSSPFSEQSDVIPATLEVGEDIAVKVQLLDGRHYSRWPVERRQVVQRYADVPPAELIVPTAESFAGWKTAWHDRGAARDLYDLWALAGEGHINPEAADLFASTAPPAALPASSCSRRRHPRRCGATSWPGRLVSTLLPLTRWQSCVLAGRPRSARRGTNPVASVSCRRERNREDSGR